MKVEIERFSFFKGKEGGTLRYSEHSPIKECKEHQICNCTKNVTTRPEGIPTSVSTHCKILHSGIPGCTNGRDMELSLSSSFPGYKKEYSDFTVRWKEEGLERPHAYFWQAPNRFNIEITKKGCSFDGIDCFMSKLFFGNKVDISELMNGHSPSKIIKLEVLDPKDLWVHECSWGHESMRVLPQDRETELWWGLYKAGEELRRKVDPYLSPEFSVDDIKKMAESDRDLLTMTGEAFDSIRFILDNLPNTSLYTYSLITEKEAHDKEGSIHIDLVTGKAQAYREMNKV